MWGPECVKLINLVTNYAAPLLETDAGTQEIAELFGIDIPINKSDFWFFLADIFVMGVQYGNRNSMCTKLNHNFGTFALLASNVAELASQYGVSYADYDAATLSGTTVNYDSASRQWTYQYCNEFGWYQTPNDEHPMRSQVLVESFWPDYCQRVFGKEMTAGTDATNKLYGGLDIEGDNIYFLNGSEDPWQWAAMRTLTHPDTTQSTMFATYIECDTCAHCVDFH